MSTFSKRLESLRGKDTQRVFAKKLGVPLTTYTNWILGLRTPNIDALSNLCSQLGVSADWLLGLDSSPDAAANPRAERAEEKLKAVKKSLIALVREL